MSELDNLLYSENAIPEYSSIEESVLFIVENGERDYNEMMRNIGINELITLESTGDLVVYNESAISNIIDNIVNWLKARYQDFLALCKKVIDTISAKTSEAKKKYTSKVKATIKDNASRMKDGTTFGKGYAYDGSAESYITAVKNYTKTIYTAFETTNYDAESIEGIKERLKNAKDKFVSDTNSSGKGGLRKAVIDTVRGEQKDITKSYVTGNIDKIISDATGVNNADIKDSIKLVKSLIDADIKRVKGIKKASGDSSKLVSATLPYLKDSKSALITICGAVATLSVEQVTMNLKIVARLAVTRKEKKVSESVEPSTFQTSLASLFDF